MHKARLGPHVLREVGQESDDVVLGLAFDFIDARDIPLAALPYRLGGLGGNSSQLHLGVAGVGFDFEPDAEFVVRLPNLGHGGPSVARNHGPLSS